jgi:hypothetical protein
MTGRDMPLEYLCDFDNRVAAELVRNAFAKLGISTQGHMAEVRAPPPVVLVRFIRDQNGPHPRAAVFIAQDLKTGARQISVVTYRQNGDYDKHLLRELTADEWASGEPEPLPLAKRATARQ